MPDPLASTGSTPDRITRGKEETRESITGDRKYKVLIIYISSKGMARLAACRIRTLLPPNYSRYHDRSDCFAFVRIYILSEYLSANASRARQKVRYVVE